MLLLLVFAAVASAAVTPNTTVSGSLTPAAIVPFAYGFPDCVNGPLKGNAVCNTTLDPVTRAQAVVSLFSIDDLVQNSVHSSPGVSSLGLPPYNWWSEASHGVAWTGPGVSFADSGDFSYATSFPQPILLGAAFDDDLTHAVATVISTEARAFANAQRAGLDYFTPNINPWRDPRWGRGQETPGEDSFHTAQYVKQLVSGFEGGVNPEPYLKVIAVCKHFAAYDMDDWGGVIQRQFNAIVTTQEMSEYYLQPFQSCVRDASATGVMCSYNSVNGVPACGDAYLLTTLLSYWGFGDDSWVVSDCDAVQSIFDEHNFTTSYASAAALALKSGVDINCGSTYTSYLPEALDEGLIVRADLEKALVRQYASLVRLGYFDSPAHQPYRQLNWDDVSTPSSEQLAYTVAAEGIVLLKNDGTLPLNKTLKKMALVGPWGNATDMMQGNYYGTPPFLITPLMGATAAGYEVTFVQALASVTDTSTDFAAAVAAARAADVVVFAGGIDNSVEAEGLDRVSIEWPGSQLALIQALAAVAKPFVVVQLGAGQVDDSWLLASKAVNAIIWGGYPGQAGGSAIFDVLSGKVAPAGRLPLMQYPADFVNVIGMFDMGLRPNTTTGNPGRTYRWYTGKPIIDYGFGLHYTTFALQWQSTPAAVYDIGTLIKNAGSAAHLDLGAFDTFGVSVRNTGKVTSDFVALLFVKTTAGPPPYPNKSLIGYTRVHGVKGGTVATARISVALGAIARMDTNGNAWIYPGQYELSLDVPEQVTHRFVLTGSATPLWDDFPAPPPPPPATPIPESTPLRSDDEELLLLEHDPQIHNDVDAQTALRVGSDGAGA